jgi:hypothetical protein
MNDLNIRIAKAKGYGNPYVNIPQWDRDTVLAMELMDEIWKKCPQAMIAQNGVYLMNQMNNDLIQGKPTEAICIAWLEIFEKEEK